MVICCNTEGCRPTAFLCFLLIAARTKSKLVLVMFQKWLCLLSFLKLALCFSDDWLKLSLRTTFQPIACNAETNTRREISMRDFPRKEMITRISVVISTNTGFHSQGQRRPSVHSVCKTTGKISSTSLLGNKEVTESATLCKCACLIVNRVSPRFCP